MTYQCLSNLQDTKRLLSQLSNDNYTQPLPIFSGSSIGQHTRHLLEFFGCLIDAPDTINYDLRPRNLNIESDTAFAIQYIEELCRKITNFPPDKPMLFSGECADDKVLHTSLLRELSYCLEHSIHHQALIKIGLFSLNLSHLVSPEFGVAPSTLQNNLVK